MATAAEPITNRQLTGRPAGREIEAHRQNVRTLRLRDLLTNDSERGTRLTAGSKTETFAALKLVIRAGESLVARGLLGRQ